MCVWECVFAPFLKLSSQGLFTIFILTREGIFMHIMSFVYLHCHSRSLFIHLKQWHCRFSVKSLFKNASNEKFLMWRTLYNSSLLQTSVCYFLIDSRWKPSEIKPRSLFSRYRMLFKNVWVAVYVMARNFFFSFSYVFFLNSFLFVLYKDVRLSSASKAARPTVRHCVWETGL